LNLDLFCVELRCECEAIIERLPEGDEEDLEDMSKSERQRILDDLGDDDGGGY
jgi:putative membrane protein